MDPTKQNQANLPTYEKYSKGLDEVKIGKAQSWLSRDIALSLKDYAEYKLSSGIGRFIEKIKLCFEGKGWVNTKDFNELISNSKINPVLTTQLEKARDINIMCTIIDPLTTNKSKLKATAVTVENAYMELVNRNDPAKYKQFIETKELKIKLNKLQNEFKNKDIGEILKDQRFINYHHDFFDKYPKYQAYFNPKGELQQVLDEPINNEIKNYLIEYLAKKEMKPTTESEYKTLFPKGVDDDKLARELQSDINRYQEACILKINDNKKNWPEIKQEKTQNFKELIPEPIRKIFVRLDSKPTPQELSNLRRVAAFMTAPACTLLYKRVQQQSGDDVNPRSLTQEMNFFEKDGNCYLERKVLYHLFDTTNLIDNAPPIATLEASMIVNLSEPQAKIEFKINEQIILNDEDKNKIMQEKNERNLALNKKLKEEALNVQSAITPFLNQTEYKDHFITFFNEFKGKLAEYEEYSKKTAISKTEDEKIKLDDYFDQFSYFKPKDDEVWTRDFVQNKVIDLNKKWQKVERITDGKKHNLSNIIGNDLVLKELFLDHLKIKGILIKLTKSTEKQEQPEASPSPIGSLDRSPEEKEVNQKMNETIVTNDSITLSRVQENIIREAINKNLKKEEKSEKLNVEIKTIQGLFSASSDYDHYRVEFTNYLTRYNKNRQNSEKYLNADYFRNMDTKNEENKKISDDHWNKFIEFLNKKENEQKVGFINEVIDKIKSQDKDASELVSNLRIVTTSQDNEAQQKRLIAHNKINQLYNDYLKKYEVESLAVEGKEVI